MVCDYRYYEEDDPKGVPDSKYYARMKIYNCNPCKSKPNRRYYCKDRRNAGSPAAPALSAIPELPAVPVSPGLKGLPILSPPGPGPVVPGPLVPGLQGLSSPLAAPVILSDYWADDYYRRIRNL
jgi:hypothetical protein